MIHISCLDAFRDGETLWLSNYDYNAFIKWNMDSGCAEIVDFFPQISRERGRLHRRVFRVGEKLYFIPFRGNRIHIWNLTQEMWEEVRISEEDIIIADAYMSENCFWIFPSYRQNPIMLFHIDTRQIEMLTDLTREIGDYVGKYITWMFLDITCVCQRENFFYLAEYRRTQIFCIDSMEKKLVRVWNNEESVHDPKAGNDEKRIKQQGINLCGEDAFWLTSMEEKEVYLWKPEEGIKKIYRFQTKMYGNRVPFFRVVDVNETYALVLPCHSNRLFRINKTTDEITGIRYPSEFARRNIYSLYCGYDKKGNEVFLYPKGGNGLLIIDVEKEKAYFKAYNFNETDGNHFAKLYRQYITRRMYTGKLDESYGGKGILAGFLDEVASGEECAEPRPIEAVGKKIYQYCKEICLRGDGFENCDHS